MTTLEMKSLLTKFFYKNEHLCFQILIQGEEETTVYSEFIDYNEYKQTFDMLQKNLSERSTLKVVSDRILKSETTFAKVA